MIVLNSHARMVEIVQMKSMISTVIVSPGTQAKTAPSVRKIALTVAFLKPPQPLFTFSVVFLLLVVLFFVGFINLFFTSCFVYRLTYLWLNNLK